MIPKISSLNWLRVGLVFVFTAVASRADVTLHALFSDNMVLQRGVAAPVWGWADEGEDITVEFRGQRVKTKAKDGKWMVRLKKLKAGGPEELKVTGKNTITLKNVLVGEVWIASGQSNMEWPLKSSFGAERDIAASANPMIRLYTVPKLKADAPTNNINASWKQCEPATCPGFSAVAYYFARDLQNAMRVPVGIIHTSWGGSPAEVWMSEQVLASNPSYKRDIVDSYTETINKAKETLAQYEQEAAEAKKEGKPFTKRRPGTPWKPSELYNGMIAPLIPFAIKGAIWYQGESNAGRAWQYRTLFADMIRNWRHDWGQGDFTFLEVQLAPFMAIKEEPAESTWAELREAQSLATKILPKVGIAVITDVGEEKDIHPKKKEPVGGRLALAARKIAYGEKVVYSGPTYKSMKIKGDTAIINFDHVGSGLEAREEITNLKLVKSASFSPDGKQLITSNSDQSTRVWDLATGKPIKNMEDLRIWNESTGRQILPRPLKGFAICGEDKKFVWARAEIAGDHVVVSSPEVSQPVAVRYGWADFPVVDLWNKDGLPASPFRTDDFPMITAPKAPAAEK